MKLYIRQSGNLETLPAPAFANPNENTGPGLLAVTGFMTSFALLVVIARMYVRVFMLKSVGTDDYVMVLSMYALLHV